MSSAGKREIEVQQKRTGLVVRPVQVQCLTDQDSTEKRIRRKIEEKDLGIQDSTEKRIRRETEEEDVSTSDTSDSSDSEEEIDEDISTEIVPEKEQTVSLPSSPSYIKSCSETQIKTSTILEHTWKINQFMWLFNTVKTMMSPPFPETGQYVIQMEVSGRQPHSFCDIVCFYILTNNTFNAFCTTTVTLSSGKVVSSKSISGPISNNTLLIEIRRDLGKLLLDRDTLIIDCKFEFFCNLVNKTIRMTPLPSSTEFSKDVTYFEDLTFDEFRSKNKMASEKKSVDGK